MANKVGPLIKEARTGAGLTQEQLSKKVDGLTAADISKAERGEKELSQNQLRQIAKATGVTQASLLNAAKESGTAKAGTTTAKKTASSSAAKKTSSTGTAKKTSTTAAKKTSSASTAKKTGTTTEAKKTSSTAAAKKTGAAAAKKETELKLTAAEKKLVELYRAADKNTKDAAVKVLKGEKLESGLLSTLLSGAGGGLLDGAMDLLGLGKK